MRKFAFVALIAAFAVGMVSFATAANEYQTTKIDVDKTKLDKKKFKPVGLKTGVSTPVNDEAEGASIPAKATQTVLNFDKNLKFNTKTVPTCSANLENTSTAQAKAACGNSQVSVDGPDTFAEVMISFGELGVGTYDAVVTAFNGPGKGQITLHANVPDLAATTIITGTIGKSGEKGFKTKITFPVPLIGGGSGAISEFYAYIKGSGKGKKYVTARCKGKKHKIVAKTDYVDHSQSEATATDKCKAKKSKKKKK